MFVAPDPAAKLMQLGQAEPVGIVDDDRIGIGNIDAGFDNRRAEQNVRIAGDEANHRVFEFVLGHLAVSDVDFDGCIVEYLPQFVGKMLDGLDAVVQVKDLAVAAGLQQNRLANRFIPEAADFCHNRTAVHRRRGQRADIPQADQRHVQRARDGRGGHRQNIDIDTKPFEAFLVLDAKPLLLVDNHQAQILKPHIVTEQPMRADENIDRPPAAGGQNFAGLPSARCKTVDDLNGYGKIGKAFLERPAVLHTQNRRGHQHRHLLVGLDGFECGPHGQFCFAVTDITAQQAVHRTGRRHVVLNLGRGGNLVGRFLVGKRFLKLPLPDRIGAEIKTAELLTFGLRIQQFGGQFLDTLATFSFCFSHFFVPILLSVGRLGVEPINF